MEKREQQSDDSAGLTLPSLGCQLSPAPVWPWAPAGTTRRMGQLGQGGRCRGGEPGAVPAWDQQWASRGWGGAGCAGCWVPAVPGGDGPSNAASALSPSPLLRLASGCPLRPTGTSLPRALTATCWPEHPAAGSSHSVPRQGCKGARAAAAQSGCQAPTGQRLDSLEPWGWGAPVLQAWQAPRGTAALLAGTCTPGLCR